MNASIISAQLRAIADQLDAQAGALQVNPPASRTVAASVAEYRAQRARDGLCGATLSQQRKKLDVFCVDFGELDLHAVTVGGIRIWLESLSFIHRPWTIKDYLKVVAAFFAHCHREGWIAGNPALAVRPPRIEAAPINILTVPQTAALFAANYEMPCIGRLALEAFGGLRFSSAGRLVLADLKFDREGIELPGKKHKSGRRHYIDGTPENLWAWLKHAPAACWEMTERQYLKAKGEAFIRAKVASTPNCLRHSFATYHVASRKDASATAILMQHTSPTMLYKHYKGNASAADGAAYFQIAP